MGAVSSTTQESPRKYGLAGESGAIICTTLFRPPRLPTNTPANSSTPTPTTTSSSTSGVSSSSSTSAVIAVGKETVDLFSTVTGDRRLRRTAQPSGSIFTCAEARADSILGAIIVLGSDSGELLIVDAASLSDIKVIKVSGSTIGNTKFGSNSTGREIVTVASALSSAAAAAASSSSSSSSTPKPRSNTLTGSSHSPGSSTSPLVRITAVSIVTKAVVLVGLSDGSARSYSLANSELIKSFGPPPISSSATPSSSSSTSSTTTASTSPTTSSSSSDIAVKKSGPNPSTISREVVALAVYNMSPVLLAIGRSDGSIDKYDLDSGTYLVSFKTAPGLLCLIPMLRLNCLACVHSLQNTLTIWDAGADRVIQLDFSAELQSIGRRLSKMTFAKFDEHRSVLLCGDDAGSIFTRKVSRISETSDLAVKLVRVAAPAPTASAPTRVTSMWYDSRSDTGFTGDASGLVRVVSSASGVSIKDIAADLVTVKKDLSLLHQTFESLLLKKTDTTTSSTPVTVSKVVTRPLALTVSAAVVKSTPQAEEKEENVKTVIETQHKEAKALQEKSVVIVEKSVSKDAAETENVATEATKAAVLSETGSKEEDDNATEKEKDTETGKKTTEDIVAEKSEEISSESVNNDEHSTT